MRKKVKMKKQNEDEDEEANEDEDEDEEADEEEDAEEEEDKNEFVQHLEPRACVPSWISGVPSSYEERQKIILHGGEGLAETHDNRSLKVLGRAKDP
jgi:hypothetical protein